MVSTVADVSEGMYLPPSSSTHTLSYSSIIYVPIEVFAALSSLTAGATKGPKLWLGCSYCCTEQDAEASKQEGISGGHLLRGRDRGRDGHLVVVEVQGEVPKCRRVRFNIRQMVM